MKILLINPICQPSMLENDISFPSPPLGLCYVASVLRENGHEVRLLERRRIIDKLRRTEKNLSALDKQTSEHIKSFQPDYVGITATTPLIMDAYRTAKLVKEVNPEIKVLAGGCHPSAEPGSTLGQCREIDLVCIGEGEFTMLDYVKEVPIEKIPGVAYRENGEIAFTEQRSFYPDIDDLPFPARDLLDREYYFSPNSSVIRGFHLRQTPLLAARGCPYRCTYCQSGQLAKSGKGKFVRFHSPERVIEEIKHLISDYGINGLLFAEDVFSVKKGNVNAICEMMIREGIHKKIQWAAHLRVEAADKELFEVMKKAGCVQIKYGCESGSQKSLDMIQKKTTVKKNFEAIRLAKEAGLTAEANIIIGLPGETERDLLDTVKFLKNAKPDRINRGKLYPLPGTPIFEDLKRANKLDINDWNDLWDRYVASDHTFANMSPDRFKKIRARMDRETTYRRNCLYMIKNNWHLNPMLAVKQFILMLLVCGTLYLPVQVWELARRVAGFFRIQHRYIVE